MSNISRSDWLCGGSSSFGNYRIKVGNSKYEMVIPSGPSYNNSFTNITMKYVGVVKIPNEFIEKIVEIFPLVPVEENETIL